MDFYRLWAQNPLPVVGFNGSGLPIGEDDGYEKLKADEDLSDPRMYDDLVVAIPNGGLLLRSMYFDLGWTPVREMYVRYPGMCVLKLWADRLFEAVGWRVRATDLVRDPDTNLEGMKYSVRKVLADRTKLSYEDFCDLATRALPASSTVSDKDARKVNQLCLEATKVFCKTELMSFDRQEFSYKLNTLALTVLGNIGLDPRLKIDRYAIGTHVTGGPIDYELVKADGTLVNQGVPVDEQGYAPVQDFFEDKPGTLLRDRLVQFGNPGLISLKARQRYYRKAVEKRSSLSGYLTACGVDLQEFFGNESYFQQIWTEIRNNRRVDEFVASLFGILAYGGESWHRDLHDGIGGKRFLRTNIVSGSPTYAMYRGQKECAWGNAMPLYERKLVRPFAR